MYLPKATTTKKQQSRQQQQQTVRSHTCNSHLQCALKNNLNVSMREKPQTILIARALQSLPAGRWSSTTQASVIQKGQKIIWIIAEI